MDWTVKSGFKRTINWNKCQSKLSTERPNQYFYYLIDPSFQGLSYKWYYLLIVKIKNYNVLIDGQKKEVYLMRYDSIQKIATGRGDYYKTGCLLDYNYLKKIL